MGYIMKFCNSCGGECKDTAKNGQAVCICTCCGRIVDPDEKPNRAVSFLNPTGNTSRTAAKPQPSQPARPLPKAPDHAAPSPRQGYSAPAAPTVPAAPPSAVTHFAAPVATAVPTAPAASAASAAPTQFSVYGDKALSGEDLYEKVIPSVVEIAVQSADASAAASGFVVSSKGFVLTNAHAVLDETGKLFEQIFVRSGNQYYAAFPVALGEPRGNQSYDTIDLCLLYVRDLPTPTPVSFGDINLLRNGQRVYLIGNSLGEGTCITSGIISDKDRYVGELSYPYIMTDASANPGNSGGPLLNEMGELIGVLVAGITSAKGMNYAIPVNMVNEFLTLAINGTKLCEADLGELNRYKARNDALSTYSLSCKKIFDGVKLLVDIVDYVLGLFS